jgi:streptogramin lyase
MMHRFSEHLRRGLVLLAACVSAASLPIPAAAQTITDFPGLGFASGFSITAGPDGNLWFTDNTSRVQSISPSGVVRSFDVGVPSAPDQIVTGSDGALWFIARLSGNGKIGRITTDGSLVEFSVCTSSSFCQIFGGSGIAAGPDGALWFSVNDSPKSRVMRISTAGAITGFDFPSRYLSGNISGITAGPDGALWFALVGHDSGNNFLAGIGRVTTAGVVTEFPLISPNPNTSVPYPLQIAAGPDGNLWFTTGDLITDQDPTVHIIKIGRITTVGTMSFFDVSAIPSFGGIVTGPDGALWFTTGGNRIGRITTSGSVAPLINHSAMAITTGPDGNLWFTESGNGVNRIGRLAPAASTSPLLAAVLPSSRSVQVGGNVATAFSSILNNSASALDGCGIAPASAVPANFSFQTTDPATNLLTGSPNTRVSIPAHGVQTFLMAFAANAPQYSINVQIGYACTGADATATIVGVNTLLLTFDANPVADMIAVGLTPSNDGFSHIPGVSGTGIFVTAATNIGVSKQLTARARFLDASTQATTLVCETFSSGPQLGQCKATPSATVTRTINTNENTTWTAFITATGTIPADPAKHRAIFQFEDGPAIRGSTSTAVTTQ